MRTTIDIPEDLLDKARRVSGARTKQETVIAALNELIRRSSLERLRSLAGKIDLDIDLNISRGRHKLRGHRAG